MDQRDLATLISVMMEQIFAGGALVERLQNVQVVVCPVLTWPDGEPAVWAVVNCPN